MSVITIIKGIKDIHPDSIVFVKNGQFYEVYGRDSYIVSYLFKYKINEVEKIKKSGFPLKAINGVMVKLENKKINYLIVDKRNNYEVDEKCDNKNLNTYYKVYEQAKNYINSKKRIDNIYNYLLHNVNNKRLINEIEKAIENEGRKV